MARAKTHFVCQECGSHTSKWLGKCSDCGAWNSFVEETIAKEDKSAHHTGRTFRLPDATSLRAPIAVTKIPDQALSRTPTQIQELDRVLGGGLVPGALILIGGDPGIGKSTLVLQALDRVVRTTEKGFALYVTGEESLEQVKLRATRTGVDGDRLLLFAETRADVILQQIEETNPSVVAIDSIQAVYDPEVESAPGSVSQIREVAARFLYLAKARNIPTFLIGHVTKDGALAGPRVLEHLVDTVLYFESSTGHPYRILRAHKNRFGSTNEIGVFEMRAQGLMEVSNPSELFLSERPKNAPGSLVLPALEGTRPLLVEVQALVTPAVFGTPRRTCLGFDSARAALLAAVLEQRAGIALIGCDVFVNIVGGIEVNEPAADLAVAVSLASSLRNRVIANDTVVFGELGLAGEVRGVTQPEVRLTEAYKLGFRRAILPAASLARIETKTEMKLIGVKTLNEALQAVMD